MTSAEDIQMLIVIVVLIIAMAAGVFSGKMVKNTRDFAASGQKAGLIVVVGMLMSIAGGAATIGTAQMAFEYGLTGWCFSLGSGIACLIMGLFYAKPLRRSTSITIPQYLGEKYGSPARTITSIVSMLAMFIQVFGQLLSGNALLTTIFGIGADTAIFITAAVMITYILFGGSWGAGIIGILKTVMICGTLAISGVIAYRLSGGMQGLTTAFPPFPWFHLFGRGFSKDGFWLITVIMGVLSTQTNLQAMFAGKDVATCRKAAFISAVLIPLTGLVCVLVGMYMKIRYPDMNSAQVLPVFLLQFTSPVVGGLAAAALLLAVIGTGAGLTLGISIMMSKDIYGRLLKKDAGDRTTLLVSRITVVAVLLLSMVFSRINLGSKILSWAYLSMGLRSAAVFFPLLFALFTLKKLPDWIGILTTATGPAAILFSSIFLHDLADPAFIGLFVSTITFFLCYMLYNLADKHKLRQGS